MADDSGLEEIRCCLSAIAERDGELGAFTWLNPRVVEQAVDSHSTRRSTPRLLQGVTMAVKELFDVAGAPQTGGSFALQEVVATKDAVCVRALREEGAVVVGLTRSHEFGWGITTQHETRGGTGHPDAPSRIPGGSSGGSAVAIAAGMARIALGTDTGGSTRIPAAFCGVVGFKPTWGLVPLTGSIPLAPSLDTAGLIARSVADIALVFRVLAPSHDSREVHWDTIKIGVPVGILDSQELRTEPVRSSSRLLARMGATIHEVELPTQEHLLSVFANVQMREALVTHRDVLGTYPSNVDRYGRDVRERLAAAATQQDCEYEAAIAAREKLRQEMVDIFEDVDALLTPIASVAPPQRTSPDFVTDGSLTLRAAVMGDTVLQNLCGLPSISVPFGLTQEGFPAAVQVTSARHRDGLCLELAEALLRQVQGL